MKISISASCFHQNWEDTEGRKKLSKINARVSVCSTTCLLLEDQDSNKPFIFRWWSLMCRLFYIMRLYCFVTLP